VAPGLANGGRDTGLDAQAVCTLNRFGAYDAVMNELTERQEVRPAASGASSFGRLRAGRVVVAQETVAMFPALDFDNETAAGLPILASGL
jgi:hypothetical protein